MSQNQEYSGWKPSRKLRKGQRELYEKLVSTDKSQYLVELPTGYGKSWCACIAYAVLRSKGKIDRCLIIVPTDLQRLQYYAGLQEDLDTLGIQYRGIERCVNGNTWVIKKSLRNESDIFIAGIGSISANPGYYADLMCKGRWLIVADELHHYAQGKTWGDCLNGLDYQVRVGMSATPLRKDGTMTIFGDAEFDVKVSINDAFKEGAIRRFSARIIDYTLTYSTLGDEPKTALLSELSDEAEGDVSSYEIRREVRYFSKYVSSIFLLVINQWIEYEGMYPGQNQILVFALSCRHAESIAEVFNNLAFPGLPEPFADWIGVGDAADKRSDKENQEILERFQSNKLPCLVQVNKAGEGFNNKRCSIGLMLDMVGDTPQKRQHIGRFLRVNSQSPGIDSVIFISSDHPCRSLLENLEEQMPSTAKDDGGDSNGSGWSKQLKISDVFIVNTEFHSEKIVYPYGTKEKTIEKFVEQCSSEEKEAIDALPKEDAAILLSAAVERWVKSLLPQPKPLTSEEARKQVLEQVQRNTGALVNYVLRKRYGSSIPKSAKGDYFKAVHSRWKRQNGGHDNATTEDLVAKNKWLQELSEQISETGLPSWLML